MKPIDAEELLKRFTYHPPKDGQAEKYTQIRTVAHEFGKLLLNLTPPSREQSTALTKLEECVMHANAAIARRE